MADADHADSEIDLGFVEKCERPILLTSIFQPSKLGGKPAWLRIDSLPTTDDLKCSNCSSQMIFLCQIYIPIELKNTPMHKTIFIFCCRNGHCSKTVGFVKVFRCVKVINDDDLLDEEFSDTFLHEKLKSLVSPLKICSLCGCYGNKACSSCHKVFYCAREHQILDWKEFHKKICKSDQQVSDVTGSWVSSLLFPEYEVVIEAEPSKQERMKKNNESEIEKYEKYLMKNKDIPLDKQIEKDLKKLDEKKTDQYFQNFKDRIAVEPDQILRYDLGGEPLWVSGEHIPQAKDIPVCSCGAKRIFEFQILPQMLNYLGIETTLDSLDWGTLCIYTCSENCVEGAAYKKEFVWKQDFSPEDVLS